MVGGTAFGTGAVPGGGSTGGVGSTDGGSTTGSTTGMPGSGSTTAGLRTDSQAAATLSSASALPLSLPLPHVILSAIPSLASTNSSPSPRLSAMLDGDAPQAAELQESHKQPVPSVRRTA